MKTQAELDAAVIEAAVAWERDYMESAAHLPMSGACVRAELIRAVRARREAMRAHKAALVHGAMSGACFSEKIDSDAFVMGQWETTTPHAKQYARDWIKRILAAPDEPSR